MRLVEFDRSKLTPTELYYIDGLALVKSKEDHPIVQVLEGLWKGKARDPFTWEQSMNSFSLRPNVYEYDPCFMDFLFDNNIPAALDTLTGRNLVLAHVQVVKTEPGRSYQDWHRDTYQFAENDPVGAMPPAHKVLFYPRFENPEPRLKFILGSNRAMINDPKFDEMLVRKFETDVIESGNGHAVIFESSLLHGVIPDVNPAGSIRVMYSFVEYHQFEKRFAGKPHHEALKKMYETTLYGDL